MKDYKQEQLIKEKAAQKRFIHSFAFSNIWGGGFIIFSFYLFYLLLNLYKPLNQLVSFELLLFFSIVLIMGILMTWMMRKVRGNLNQKGIIISCLWFCLGGLRASYLLVTILL